MHLNTNIYNGGGCPCSSDDSERRYLTVTLAK